MSGVLAQSAHSPQNVRVEPSASPPLWRVGFTHPTHPFCYPAAGHSAPHPTGTTINPSTLFPHSFTLPRTKTTAVIAHKPDTNSPYHFFLIRLFQLHHLVHGLLVRGVARLQHLHHMLLAGRTHCRGGFTRYHGIARPAQVAAGCLFHDLAPLDNEKVCQSIFGLGTGGVRGQVCISKRRHQLPSDHKPCSNRRRAVVNRPPALHYNCHAQPHGRK